MNDRPEPGVGSFFMISFGMLERLCLILKKRTVSITPARLSGWLRVMPSKSMSHRAAICAALAGKSAVKNVGLSDDVIATCRVLNLLGYSCYLNGTELFAAGRINNFNASASLRLADCGESGSTLRLLLPLALDGIPTRFTGRGRLLSRPMKPYLDLFGARGVSVCHTPEYIDVCGQLSAGLYSLPGDVSSQFISGLMFALPRLDGDSIIELTSPLESRSYVELTLRALAAFGVEITSTMCHGRECYEIPGRQIFKSARVSVEGDYSHAAFWLVAGAIGGGISLSGLDMDSAQGDAAIIDILRKMNTDIEWHDGELRVYPSRLRGAEINISQTPDIFPILSVAACAAEGETILTGGGRLRVKESDRLSAMAEELSKLGAEVRETRDSLYVRGGGKLRGGAVSAHADHRIAMSMAVAASVCEGKVEIDDADCVKKSAPDFWNEYASAGGGYEFECGVR